MKKNYNKFFGKNQRTIKLGDEPKNANNIDNTNPKPKDEELPIVGNCKLLNLRERPNKQSQVICVLKAGENLMVESTDKGWARVYTSSGIHGFVMEKYIIYPELK